MEVFRMNKSMNTSNRTARSGLSPKEYEERKRASSTNLLLLELSDCKILIKELKGKDISAYNNSELHHHNKSLDLEKRKKKAFIKKLADLGYEADKRGRPRKDANEKYKSTHKRTTVYFSTEIFEYLVSLKKSNEIPNVSHFINELLSSYKCLAETDTKEKFSENCIKKRSSQV
jgi:hypothetical protein